MGLFDIFRRAPAIRDPAALADFIDERAAFLVQKGIYEYARARAGRFSMMLMKEAAFIEAVNRSRWRAFPLGLAMVAEMVEGLLRPAAGEDWRTTLAALGRLVLSVYDRYPRPSEIDAATWQAGRDDLALRLERIGAHPVKPVKDIPEPMAEPYFALMPVHEKMLSADLPTARNYLKLTLINFHSDLAKRMDVPAVVAALHAPTA
jgi:hypothetical protein